MKNIYKENFDKEVENQKRVCAPFIVTSVAIHYLIKDAIENKTYTVFNHEHEYQDYQPVVIFGFSSEPPLFGLFLPKNGHPSVLYPTADGEREMYI